MIQVFGSQDRQKVIEAIQVAGLLARDVTKVQQFKFMKQYLKPVS